MEDRKPSSNGALIAGFLAGASLTAAAWYWLKSRNQEPERIISDAKGMCDNAIKKLEARLKKDSDIAVA